LMQALDGQQYDAAKQANTKYCTAVMMTAK
jgi:hypothetical protein